MFPLFYKLHLFTNLMGMPVFNIWMQALVLIFLVYGTFYLGLFWNYGLIISAVYPQYMYVSFRLKRLLEKCENFVFFSVPI